MNYEFDNVDKQILSLLMADARKPYSEIAKEILVSPGTVHVRMKKMEQAGVVKGAILDLDNKLLGYDLRAFIGVYLQKGSTYNSVIDQLNSIPEIIEAHYTTGVYSIFAKIACRNTDHLREVLNVKIQGIEGIQRTETIISLEESIKRQPPVI